MWRLSLVTCSLLAVLWSPLADAQQAKPSSGKDKWSQYEVKGNATIPAKDGAERVYSSSAKSVVFLIARRANELHSSASGVILAADGYIATNYHALQGADAVEIRYFPDPEDSGNYQSFNGAKLLYADAKHDIAVLKVNAKSLPFLECSPNTNCEPRTGQSVYAIGNPKGLNNTISEGIVSALRSVEGENVIQHTAAISPGSSGGALLDSKGGLLGMNSWQIADAQNLNFAIAAVYVLQALAEARGQRVALSFPREDPMQVTTSPEESSKSAREQESTKDKAVSQMHRIVEAIKQCPPPAPTDVKFALQKSTKPLLQDWDVVTSDSLRSPFQGFVRFRTSGYYEETDEAKQSKKLDAEYRQAVQGMKWCEELHHISCYDTEYRYEFDLGSNSPELRKATMSIAVIKGPTVYEPRGGTCWDGIAKSPESVFAEHREPNIRLHAETDTANAADVAMTQQAKAEPAMTDQWNKTAISADFVEFGTRPKEGMIDLGYMLTNTTNTEYRIGSMDDVTTYGRKKNDGLLYIPNERATFEVPLLIPPHGQVIVVLHLEFSPQHMSVLKPSQPFTAYKTNVINFLWSEYSPTGGFSILDEKTRYKIDLPLPSLGTKPSTR